ncbi:MAG: hypothetical protein A2015_01775 [Spirochaetes bacterium GWF1_31_7]|nr:MAG: hypothetical protein A2Y30_00725 [Spirochaetes bacterium GWE1_32_154]OHD45936.1 MAG: hypothetical protein A2Y29_16570 [Spirochaetes bacterium GWE2_31_10]OHD48101.1 MAG: hypothetical protein A2015_01775 [Spirochaetes bacterium GWF1_31_7]HBD95803.1 MarR family transcriptional regulator [Spirochaetia bacterium]HBI37116.1 MarR family transcriptional regulator [Spirochaetia bacterium]
MELHNKAVDQYMNLSRIFTENNRKFSSGLDGMGVSEYFIVYHLYNAPQKKMRRIDLADKIGLTASGVTRILAPMEKIGLVSREKTEHDARVSFVTLTSSGERNCIEAFERITRLAEAVFPGDR